MNTTCWSLCSKYADAILKNVACFYAGNRFVYGCMYFVFGNMFLLRRLTKKVSKRRLKSADKGTRTPTP